jgi:hypothetical protein
MALLFIGLQIILATFATNETYMALSDENQMKSHFLER